jgi:hypothetical protein
MTRSDVHTAFGAMLWGMALPLVGLSLTLFLAGSAWLGFEDAPLESWVGALAMASALMLCLSGSLLLWANPGPQPQRALRVKVKVKVKAPAVRRRARWSPPSKVSAAVAGLPVMIFETRSRLEPRA